jgi:hypothetical protein
MTKASAAFYRGFLGKAASAHSANIRECTDVRGRRSDSPGCLDCAGYKLFPVRISGFLKF